MNAVGNPCTSVSGEIISGIGSDPKHTAWCERKAREMIRAQRQQLGAASHLFSHDVREALLMSRVVGIVAGQENGDAPLWRMQELIEVTHRLFLHGVQS